MTCMSDEVVIITNVDRQDKLDKNVVDRKQSFAFQSISIECTDHITNKGRRNVNIIYIMCMFWCVLITNVCKTC